MVQQAWTNRLPSYILYLYIAMQLNLRKKPIALIILYNIKIIIIMLLIYIVLLAVIIL